MSANANASAELHLKMCKKVAQLTKVIFQLNTRNEDYQAEAEHSRTIRTIERERLTKDAADKMRLLQTQMQMQTATTAQKERKNVAHQQKLVQTAQNQQTAFLRKISDLETQVNEAQLAFNEQVQKLQHLAKEREKQRVLSLKEDAEVKLLEMREKHVEEVKELMTKSNAKYKKLLAEQLRVQDGLKADFVSAKHDFDKEREQITTEKEHLRLSQEMAQKTTFDQMKHELVTKIEVLLVDAENLRGSETNLREEKEVLVKKQQELARNRKQLELQLVQAQQDAQSVRRDASAHSEELQRILSVRTEKIEELAQELAALKRRLQMCDVARIQAQKEREIAQMETLQCKANASEIEAELKQQLNDCELQLENSKTDVQLGLQQLEAGQKQIKKLEDAFAVAQKSLANLQTEGAKNSLSSAKLKLELKIVVDEAKQAQIDSERALKSVKKTHESKLQELLRSHALEVENLRLSSAKELQQLQLQMKETAVKSTDEAIAKLKRNQQQVLADFEAASKTSETKVRQEIANLEVQNKKLREDILAQNHQLANLRKEHVDLSRQFANSQQQVVALEAAKNALQSSTQKSQRERDETHQKQICALETQYEKSMKVFAVEKNQQELQHVFALKQHAKALETSAKQFEELRLKQLSAQEKAMKTLYESQLAILRKEIANLQRILCTSSEKASEVQRSMEETRLLEREQFRSAIVEFAQHTAKERICAKEFARQEMENLRKSCTEQLNEQEKRLIETSRVQIASLEAKTDVAFAQLAADRQQEVQSFAQQHAEALQNLQERLNSAKDCAILAERAHAAKQVANLRSQKDMERSEAQNLHTQQYTEVCGRLEATEEALTKKTLDWANAMREGQHLAAKTDEMAQKLRSFEQISHQQVETLKRAAKHEMDRLLEENLAETKLLSVQFEETRRVMAEKVIYLKNTISEWEDKFAQRASRGEDIARIVELERIVVEKESLVRRTVEEMAYFKRELLNREEMYNKTFARTPNVGVLNPMLATPPPKSRNKTKTMELQRRRSERNAVQPATTTSNWASSQKALPPLQNNQFS